MLDTMQNFPLRTLTVFAFVGLVMMAVVGKADDRHKAADIRISIEQRDDASLQIIYDLKKGRRELIFGELEAGHRERRWQIETPGFKLLRLAEEDRIYRIDGRKFDRVVIMAKPDLVRIPKNYQPIARYGDGGVMVYTGHFWPMTGKGGRVNATFSFAPAPGAKVVAFGERANALTDWRSPMAHPAFVYLGPLQPVETPDVMAVVDPAAPDWISAEFDALTPRAFSHLAEIFGFTLKTKPNLFLAAPLGRDEGRLSYAGDALPAQFQITLEGGAWREPSAKALTIFRRATIHEAIHLWQAAARPSTAEAPGWIHEGAADAISAEAMVTLGLWDGAAFEADFDKAKAACAASLDEGSLAGAGDRRAFKALYSCGHVIAVAVSWAEAANASDFWRAFIDETRTSGDGYTRKDFYDLVETRTGNREFTQSLKSFVSTPPANPAREIDRLLVATGSPLANSRAD